MKTKTLYMLPMLGFALVGCHSKNEVATEVDAPKVVGSQIQLTPSSPQIDSLQSAAAEAHPSLLLRVNGRLYGMTG